MEPLDPLAERILREALGQNTVQTVRVEGMGSMWNGIAIGIALGAAIALAVWVGWALGDLRDDQRQDDAFIQAAYQYAPQLRDEYNRIKKEQEK